MVPCVPPLSQLLFVPSITTTALTKYKPSKEKIHKTVPAHRGRKTLQVCGMEASRHTMQADDRENRRCQICQRQTWRVVTQLCFCIARNRGSTASREVWEGGLTADREEGSAPRLTGRPSVWDGVEQEQFGLSFTIHLTFGWCKSSVIMSINSVWLTALSPSRRKKKGGEGNRNEGETHARKLALETGLDEDWNSLWHSLTKALIAGGQTCGLLLCVCAKCCCFLIYISFITVTTLIYLLGCSEYERGVWERDGQTWMVTQNTIMYQTAQHFHFFCVSHTYTTSS